MATQTSEPVVRERGPPAQWFFHAVVNPVRKLLLQSPLHFVVSDSLMLMTFTGRKSGRKYTTPFGYHEYGDDIVVITHSNWWRNLRGGAEVTLRIAAQRQVGHATPGRGPERVAEFVLAIIEDHGIVAGRRLGLEFVGEDVSSKEALLEGLDQTVVMVIDGGSNG